MLGLASKDADVAAQFIEATRNALSTLVSKAIDLAVDFIVITRVKYDILLEEVSESDDQFMDLTITIRSIPGELGTETLVYLSTRKQAYSWGVR